MKKKTVFLLGLLVVLLVMGLVFVGCGDDGSGNNGGGGWSGGGNTPTSTPTTSIPTTSTPTTRDIYGAVSKINKDFNQAGYSGTMVWSSGGTWDNNKFTSLNTSASSFSGTFQGTSATFGFAYEIEVTFSNGNTDGTITGIRHRLVVTSGNSAFATYVGLSSAPTSSNPLYEAWQSSSLSTFINLAEQRAGATVTIKGTRGQITYPF